MIAGLLDATIAALAQGPWTVYDSSDTLPSGPGPWLIVGIDEVVVRPGAQGPHVGTAADVTLYLLAQWAQAGSGGDRDTGARQVAEQIHSAVWSSLWLSEAWRDAWIGVDEWQAEYGTAAEGRGVVARLEITIRGSVPYPAPVAQDDPFRGLKLTLKAAGIQTEV